MASYNWVDITTEFMEKSSELKLGELLHDPEFGLFEAMSAIEMMDPKMDAGMLCNQAKKKFLNLKHGIETGFVKIKDLSYPELLGIIDDTYACLVTWLEGHSLAQTVFTNLYLHDPHLIEERSLRAFCISMLKIVDIIRDRINKASVFEEEDFQSLTYGFALATEITDSRASGMLKEVEDDLLRTIKNTRTKQNEDSDPVKEKEHVYATALHSRIKFTKLLFSALIALSKEKCQGIGDANQSLKQMLELLQGMKETWSLGVQNEDQDGRTRDYPTILGFEPLINQRLLPPTFPRYTKIKSREETMWYLNGLINRLKAVCTVTQVSGLHQTMEFFDEFSKPSPCVLSRSILQLLYVPTNRRILGTHSMVDVLKEAIRGFIVPPALMPRSAIANNAPAKEYVDAFLAHCVRPVFNLLQTVGHNRARQRGKWAHLLEELGTLQDEADKVDAYLHSVLVKMEPGKQHLACFGTWVLYHTLQVMLNFTLSGFELELYAVHEYHYVYWYLFEFLYNWLISTLSRAGTLLWEQETAEQCHQKTKSGKKGKKNKRRTRPHSRELTLAQAAQSMCGAYHKAVTGLMLSGKLQQPQFEYDSEEVRYNHRFAPFGCLVTPPPVQYPQFKEMTDLSLYNPPLQPEDLYSTAAKCFQQARIHYEGLTNPNNEVQILIKVCKTNFVVMKLLIGGHRKESKDPPEFDFSSHKIFPIIKIP
ncbi:hypothetical protein CAPTEDRAFT_112621 [Capitella teleta]|uniref:Protein MAK10 homolog n=1 Tax=Capitella teleta TaxID=283909 RepID=R7TYA3_CAPTE|nr:hypothetical protein CAPTEDRAFT_112621 [Capitella teleta]|eukprot:ELT98724.1 hypothetical protein CAPTEDRAFT_112621 [Capitella teleta]